VVEVHTLKPVLGPEVIQQSVAKTGGVVTVEEHNVVGGLASVVAELLAGRGLFSIRNLGLQDRFAESGTPAELVQKYGLDAVNVVAEVKALLE
jgi:transketolase